MDKEQKLTFDDVLKASSRINKHIVKTPIIRNEVLNKTLGADIFFKCETFQKTSSFKARGVFNAILTYQEKYKKFPEKIVAVSSGNHAQAISFVAKLFGLEALIYMDKNASKKKVDATKSNDAKVVICETRREANFLSLQKISDGYFFIHPSGNNDVMAGQGTACLEALQEVEKIDAIFAPIGSGGLVSGCYLASLGYEKKADVFACEPLNSNDAAISFREGKIFEFEESQKTIADGANPLMVPAICFYYLKKIAGVFEISEEEIIFWQKKFFDEAKIVIEPTSALVLGGINQFIRKNPSRKNSKILAIISGGNC
jgi:threonine dehydratase